MRNWVFFVFSIWLITTIGGCKTAKPEFSRYFPDRYSLDIPEKWRKNRKVIDAITEVMPIVVKDLEGKDFCIGCQAAYTVRLEMSAMKQVATGGYFDVYHFKAALSVYNDSGRGISRLVVVDPERDDVIFYNGTGSERQPVTSSRMAPLRASSANSSVSVQFEPYSVFEDTRSPSRIKPIVYRDILKYVEKRIYKTRKALNEIDAGKK